MMSEPCAIPDSNPRRIAWERNNLVSQVLGLMAGTAQHDFISQKPRVVILKSNCKVQVSPEFQIFKRV